MSKEYEQQYSTSTKQLQQINQTHPYQYLTNLNSVFNHYNRSTTKDFSSTSKIKLPFKKFNNIKIPQCFEQSYKKEKKQFTKLNVLNEMKEDDLQRRLWKQHKDIIKKYVQNKKGKQSKKNVNYKDKSYSQEMVLKDRNNLFLKKIIEKGTNFTYDEKKLQVQVLNKLKNLNKPKFNGIKRSNQLKTVTVDEQLKQTSKGIKTAPEKPQITEKDYLQATKQQQLIKKYKGIIRHVDYSISSKNIEKTTQLLQEMQKLVERKYQNG